MSNIENLKNGLITVQEFLAKATKEEISNNKELINKSQLSEYRGILSCYGSVEVEPKYKKSFIDYLIETKLKFDLEDLRVEENYFWLA